MLSLILIYSELLTSIFTESCAYTIGSLMLFFHASLANRSAMLDFTPSPSKLTLLGSLAHEFLRSFLTKDGEHLLLLHLQCRIGFGSMSSSQAKCSLSLHSHC